MRVRRCFSGTVIAEVASVVVEADLDSGPVAKPKAMDPNRRAPYPRIMFLGHRTTGTRKRRERKCIVKTNAVNNFLEQNQNKNNRTHQESCGHSHDLVASSQEAKME